ncbi:brain protein I3-like [Gigantopelta aegis]|uniref:brain protein I3-like n=1 Tax=Gigantopelta aegis TaxID=1735272 RepID=UPI001B88B8C8|nr:brain protein I3-like [Gigantopelta aegis]
MSDPYNAPPAYTPSANQPGSYPPPSGAPYPPQGVPYDPSKMPRPSQPSYQQYSSITVQPQQQIVVVGGCPACRVGVLEDDFTCLGVCCAVIFFPIGILCCLAMRQRRCMHCGAIYG